MVMHFELADLSAVSATMDSGACPYKSLRSSTMSFALTSNPLFSLNFKNPLLHDKPIGATPNNLQPLL